MNILEVIQTRRSIRKYKPEPISEDEVNKILEAGRWAPSAGNSQPWKFVVIQSKEIRKDLADALPTGRFISDAPLGIAVVINPGASTRPVEDGAAATQNMLLEAHSLGLGACWIGTYGTEKEERGRKVLDIPKEERLLSMIAIGRPAESPQRTRKKIEEITFTDKYGRR
jgi:nitroreductase